MHSKTIFCAAAVTFDSEYGKLNTRNIGWCANYSDLLEEIDQRGEGICEARYNYIVIEEVREGIWGSVLANSEKWLAFNDVLRVWQPIQMPEKAMGICHWTMY